MKERTTLSIFAISLAVFFSGAMKERTNVTHAAQVLTAMKRLGLHPVSTRPAWKPIMTRVFQEFSDKPMETWFTDGWDINPADCENPQEWLKTVKTKMHHEPSVITAEESLAVIAPLTLLAIWLHDSTFDTVPDYVTAFPELQPLDLIG